MPNPSQTALLAAAARAAHLEVDHEPHILHDDLAARLLGDRAHELIAYHRAHGDHPILAAARAQTVVRARYAENRVRDLADTEHAGAVQYVILGAGLDTFALRHDDIPVFEVDLPDTQLWKRKAIADAGLESRARFVPMDLTADDLAANLRDAGHDPNLPTVMSWLGVTMYLTRDAVSRTLRRIAALGRVELILDYILPAHLRDAQGEMYARAVAQAAGEQGEPWLSQYTPGELRETLSRHGFADIRDLGLADAAPGYWPRTDSLRPMALLALAHARRPR
ncbi:class I SAM-dependent methyltransferase [Actinokineospora enzanensis]|uniref:class I SAM-dependent methyltransferase n=1 Tax=Actinokineospora enzanensis TaxID=155975 RepID=UPI000399E032|nr:class I SAM-dependent methyltransferase [Actinokineospora enzanensis]